MHCIAYWHVKAKNYNTRVKIFKTERGGPSRRLVLGRRDEEDERIEKSKDHESVCIC